MDVEVVEVMDIKMIEIRDSFTLINALAIKMNSDKDIENEFLVNSGYSREFPSIMLFDLADGVGYVNPNSWNSGGRTLRTAHMYIERNYDNLVSGQVVDVEYISGETNSPKDREVLD